MHAIAPVLSVSYYEDLAAEDYYLNGGEPPGHWKGTLAAILGLDGIIQKAQFSYLMRGLSKNGKEKMVQNADSVGRVPGYDNVFSPSKSVSVLWAAASKEDRALIERAHDEAVEQALLLLEESAAFTRKEKGGKTVVRSNGFLIACYNHSTTRAQDPHLHTHAIILNLTQAEDGGWGTIIGRQLYAWRTASAAVYQANLAAALQRLGYQIVTTKSGKAFDIVGVPETLCKHFSKRSNDIASAIASSKITSRASKAGDRISKMTRSKKAHVDRPALFEQWQKEISEHGVEIDALKRLSKQEVAEAPEFTVQTLVARLAESQAVFKECVIYKAAAILALETNQSGLHAQLLAQKAITTGAVINLSHENEMTKVFSTSQVLDAEREVIVLAKRLRETKSTALSQKEILNICEMQPVCMSDEQKEATLEACMPEHLSIIQGSAGAGKTTSMSAVVDVCHANRRRVIGASVTKAAANQLQDSTNIECFTLTRLQMLLDRGNSPLQKNDVLIIDEAGQVGTFQLRNILRHAEQYQFKVILVGEDKQLDAIRHGGMLKYLSSPEVIGTKRIETIFRQKQPWDRQAVCDFRDGNADKAIAQYIKREQLKLGKDHHQTLRLLVDSWKSYVQDNPGTPYLLLAQRWEVVNELNNIAREYLQSIGRVGQQNIEVKGLVNGKSNAFNVSKGDRLRLTKNHASLGFTNGDIGTVHVIGENKHGELLIQVRLDNGRDIEINTSIYCDSKKRTYLTPAYAQTVYSSQGQTVNGESFVYYTTGMDRANTYVALSRHKKKATIFVNEQDIDTKSSIKSSYVKNEHTSKINNLAAHMSRERCSRLATSYLAPSINKIDSLSI